MATETSSWARQRPERGPFWQGFGVPDDSGAAYVIYGKASGFSANLDLSRLDGTNGFKIIGGATCALSGFSVASAGDVNGDGLADVIVGAPGATGAAYIVFGALPVTAVNRVGTAASQHLVCGNLDDSLAGPGGDDHLYGHGSAALGRDFSGDGKADVLWRNANGDVVLWNSVAGSASFTIQDLGVLRTDWTIQQASDFNGDGMADVLWHNANAMWCCGTRPRAPCRQR